MRIYTCVLMLYKGRRSRTQPETPQTCCKLWNLPACCKLSSSCSKPVDFIKLQQVAKIRLAATWYLQTYCKLFQQLAASLWITSLDKSVVATCIRLDAFVRLAASWYFQTCCKLIFSDLLLFDITDLLQDWNHKLQQVCWKHQCWYKRILLQIE